MFYLHTGYKIYYSCLYSHCGSINISVQRSLFYQTIIYKYLQRSQLGYIWVSLRGI